MVATAKLDSGSVRMLHRGWKAGPYPKPTSKNFLYQALESTLRGA